MFTGKKPLPHGLITRARAAYILNVSLATVANLEKAGTLHSIRDGGRVYYEQSEVERRARENGKGSIKETRTYTHVDGAIAAKAFALFDNGADIRTVVAELEITPAHVKTLYADWRQPDLEKAHRRREMQLKWHEKNAPRRKEKAQQAVEQAQREREEDEIELLLKRAIANKKPSMS